MTCQRCIPRRDRRCTSHATANTSCIATQSRTHRRSQTQCRSRRRSSAASAQAAAERQEVLAAMATVVDAEEERAPVGRATAEVVGSARATAEAVEAETWARVAAAALARAAPDWAAAAPPEPGSSAAGAPATTPPHADSTSHWHCVHAERCCGHAGASAARCSRTRRRRCFSSWRTRQQWSLPSFVRHYAEEFDSRNGFCIVETAFLTVTVSATSVALV